MKDCSCIQFLQWSLPRLEYRWRGFRKVRRQVCRRVDRRLKALGLTDVSSYQHYLLTHPEEWRYLDSCCDISVSHFYRDKGVFDRIGQELLPDLARQALQTGRDRVHCWSLGCCSGEEPYTLDLIWRLQVLPALGVPCALIILATDRNPLFLERARHARYDRSSLRDLPAGFVASAFEKDGNAYRLMGQYRNDVEFRRQDIRQDCPTMDFDLICCRNLVFTYFQPDLQQRTLERLCRHLDNGGYLVVGAHETLPPGNWPLLRDSRNPAIYRKTGRLR